MRTLHLPADWPEIVRLYRLPLDTPARNTEPRYNVCPTDPIDVVVERDDKRDCVSTVSYTHLTLPTIYSV